MKKALSLLLAIAMVFSLLPMNVFAAESPRIYFETDFNADMVVGDTFTVTAYLENNTGLATVCLSLDWNENAVSFDGFDYTYDEDAEEDVITSDVLGVFTTVINDELGIVTAARTKNSKKNGALFTAYFKIDAESGELGICLKNADATEYEMKDEIGTEIGAAIDTSALDGLTVGGAPVGPEMPEDAPFTAITTDAGPIVAVEYVEDLEFNYGYVPYYVVTIPADATTAYVTAPDQVVMEDWNTGAIQATGYAANLEDMSALYISYNYEDTADGPKVEIPMYMVASDWSGEVELDFVNTHAFGIEDAGYACLGLISFVYDDGSADAPVYSINVDGNMVGGTVYALNESYEEITEAKEGDLIYLDVVADDGYSASARGYYFQGQLYHCENGCFNMPAGDVTLTATFRKNHTCVYDQEIAADEYYAGEATCQHGTEYFKSCSCDQAGTDTFCSGDPVACVYVDGFCKWCGEAEPQLDPGYRFATSADVTAENGGTAVVHVKITGHSDENITTYNAYDLTLTFDSGKLELVGYDGAVKSDNGSVTVVDNTIRIVGCGETKTFGTEIATLTFRTKAEGAAEVTIDKVQVSEKEESVKEDAPEAIPAHHEDDTSADDTPDVSVVLVPFTVTKPGFITGADKVLNGESYSFSYTDTDNYTYSDLVVTVGGVEVEVTEVDGQFVIENVTGAVEITATQTANSYQVTKPGNVTGGDTATYGQDYVFTVTPGEDMMVGSVTIMLEDGTPVRWTYNSETGEYTIAGKDITGAFTITVEEVSDGKKTTVSFEGITTEEIEGGQLSVPAEVGKDFTFLLIKDSENYTYIVTVGETVLEENEDGTYTIPAELVVKDGVTVKVEKEEIRKLSVEVTEYFNVDGKTMFLVTAKWGEKVLAYGNDVMFYSDRYTVSGYEDQGVYCWLVLSTGEMNTADAVKEAAVAAIVEAAEGVTATGIRYDYDVNGTTKVDVNDAQLVYDMYNANYMDFTSDLPMRKFLEADVTCDRELTTQDVATIINVIVSGAVNA